MTMLTGPFNAIAMPITCGQLTPAGIHRMLSPSRLQDEGADITTVKTGTTNSGPVTIFYRYTDTEGIPIVFIHGNSFSSRAFERQIDSPLAKRFRLIAVDLPGHGDSSSVRAPGQASGRLPTETESRDPSPMNRPIATGDPMYHYSPQGLMDAVFAVIRELDAEDAVYVGWSLGGHLLLEAADRLACARGFMIFGTPPLGAAPTEEAPFTAHPATGLIFTPDLTSEQKSVYLESIFAPDWESIPSVFEQDFDRADGKIRAVLGSLAARGAFKDEEAIAKGLPFPIAILHGNRDQLVNPDYIRALSMKNLWKGTVIDIPEAGHTPQWEQPKLFNSELENFIAHIA